MNALRQSSSTANAASDAVSYGRRGRDMRQEPRATEQHALEGLRFLAEAGPVLSSSLDYETTLATVARLVVPQLADWCTVHMAEEGGTPRQLVVAHVDPAKVAWARELERRYPPDPNAPRGIPEVLRTGQAVLAPEITDDQLAAGARDPEHLQILRGLGVKSYMAVPLIARGRTLGAISFVSAESGRHYGPADLALAQELARNAALAVDNARLYHDARRAVAQREVAVRLHRQAEQRVRFLAEASGVLASSLDYQATLDRLAQLTVPRLADWCLVDVVEDGGAICQVAVAHADPAKTRLAWELDRRYPDNPDAPEGVPKVIRTGRAELYPEITDDLLRAVARDDEHLAAVRRLGLTSGLIVPLPGRERVLGAISLGTAESGRRLGADDLALAEELARRAASALENARLYRELEDAGRRKDQFLAMLAHELRNPLAPVLTSLHLISRVETRQDRDSVVDVMNRQVRHLARLVDDLLDVSRITRGKVQLQRERLDLSELVRHSVEDRRRTLEEGGLRLVLDVPAAPLWTRGDATRLTQVLHNLLDNATKFTPAGGEVHVRLATDPGARRAVVTVRDTGVGIEAEMLPRLFDVFTQADRTLERTRGGLGLGLALVKGLVGLHGGQVQAASEGAGRGAEFTVRLPLEEGPTTVAQGTTPARPRRQRRRILLIEDNQDAAETLRLVLEMFGHEARVAYSGPDGVRVATAWQPDVVLCDIGLPGMDGYEVARALRQHPRTAGTRLIAITGYGQEQDRRRAHEAGFDTHVIKPVDPAELEALLQSPGGS
jgi:signal transduction histidine kinase